MNSRMKITLYYICSNIGTLLQTIHAGSLMNELWQRGISLEKSLLMSLDHVYGQSNDFTQVFFATSYDLYTA